jgi:hypothetical protein
MLYRGIGFEKHDVRKDSSFPQEKFPRLVNLKPPPTTMHLNIGQKVDDY